MSHGSDYNFRESYAYNLFRELKIGDLLMLRSHVMTQIIYAHGDQMQCYLVGDIIPPKSSKFDGHHNTCPSLSCYDYFLDTTYMLVGKSVESDCVEARRLGTATLMYYEKVC